jgi:hypothetical protein
MIIKEEVIYPVTHAMTSEGLRILQGMLHKDPSRRIRLRKLIQQPYFFVPNQEFEEFYTHCRNKLEGIQQDHIDKLKKIWDTKLEENIGD